MSPSSPSKFFFSILTAVMTGVGVAYVGILGVNIIKKPEIATMPFVRLAAASKGVVSTGSSTADTTFGRLLSHQIVYKAEPIEEDAENDITFTGENLTEATDTSGAITALAYSVQSIDRNNVLVEKNANQLLPIASVTKLITAVIAKQLFSDNDFVTITPSVLNIEGATGKFKLGEKYLMKEILYPLLLVSSNDAAEALAQTYDAAHGRGTFVKAMNDWAGQIGAYRTYFRDASGLSAQNVSTAHDLSLIAKWIKEHEPSIFDITLTKAKTIRSHTWVNPTHFLSLSSYTGGKNGFTTEANDTNVSLFTLGSPQRLYSVVVLGSRTRDKDTLSVLNQAVK